MSENTKIEWCDHTFNPWEGCQKVGPGCDHCYAETRNARFGGGQAVNWGPGAPRRRTSEANWRKPLQWQAQAAEFKAKHGRRQRVFCASLADVFDNAVPVQWRISLMSLILETPDLDWLLLTKRIGNATEMLDVAFRGALAQREKWADVVPPNVWIGATITSQAEADRDIPKLIDIPARVRFLSMEPLLDAVNMRKWLDPYSCADCGFHGSDDDSGPDGCETCGQEQAFEGRDTCINCGADDQSAKRSCPRCGSHRSYEQDNGFIWSSEKRLIDWVIVGGESGPGARPMHPDWARSLRDQCAAAGVPFLFKQWGEWKPTEQRDGQILLHTPAGVPTPKQPAFHDWPDGSVMARTGKKAAGRLLDGVEHNAFPEAI